MGNATSLCQAVFVVLVKVLNSGNDEISFEKGEQLAVVRREKPVDSETAKNRVNFGSIHQDDEEAVPCPMTPPPKKKRDKKSKKKEEITNVLDFDALDFEAESESDDESSDDENEAGSEKTPVREEVESCKK